MNKEIKQLNDEILQEINRHKWLESEKRRSDVGLDFATQDWFSQHFQAWKQHKMQEIIASL